MTAATTIIGNGLQAPLLNWADGRVLTVGAASVATQPLSTSKDLLAEVSSSGDCWLTVGVAPVAAADTAKSTFLPGGGYRYIYVPAGYKIAVIQHVASTGTLAIIPMAAV